MYLIFDTETTGLPKKYQAALDDFSNWPRMVQIAWAIFDKEGRNWLKKSFIIYPDGYIISDEVAKIHRVTQERAMKEGEPIKKVLAEFLEDASRVDFLIGHNIDFDEKIVGSEIMRQEMSFDLPKLLEANKICTMKSSVSFCQIPNGRGGYKWPNLTELYNKLFQTSFPEAHDALVDVLACAKCFFELKRKGVLND
ncbi:3'-5' exonuclease [Candidatus Falkowbacteria bacterium]|nr:3'-5' exonuclease [Candidatus Falkowbacteria bacterium]NCT54915.1 3'-5' exonuclease [Candidatus Falkowbacteria bacterium]